MTAQNGAQIATAAVEAIHYSAAGCAIGPAGGRPFRDGFESGNTRSWTFVRP